MTTQTANHRRILLLGRNDLLEGMRVAAGLTIFGHDVSLVLMHRSLTEAETESEQLELLELAEIEPETTVPAMQEHLKLLDASDLGRLMANADLVLNV